MDRKAVQDLFREFVFQTAQEIRLEGYTGHQAVMRVPDTLPFHIPHSKFFEKEDCLEAGRGLLANRELHEEPVQLSQPTAIQRSIDDGDTVLVRLPPISKKKDTSSARLSSRLQRRAHLRRLPLEVIGPRGEVDFMTLIQIMREKKTDDTYYIKLKLHGKDRSPFDYRLIPSCETNPQDFYTICRKGIFRNRFGMITFRSLDELEISYYGFNKLKSNELSQEFLMIKVFKQWKKDLWTKRWISRKCDIDSLYLYNKGYLRRMIFAIKETCNNLSKSSFFNDTVIENLRLHEFPDLQKEKAVGAVQKVQKALEHMKETVKRACENELSAAGYDPADKYGISDFRGSTFKFLLTLTRKKKPTLDNAREQSEKKRICLQIARGIKVVDFMVQDMLFNLHLNSMDHVLEVLKKHLVYVNSLEVYESDELSAVTGKERPAYPQLPMFIVTLGINEDSTGLQITPDLSDFLETFQSVFTFWNERTDCITPLYNDTDFREFTRPGVHSDIEVIANHQKLHEFLDEDTTYKNKVQIIFFTIKDNFDIMTLYTKRLYSVLEYYKWCCSYSEEEMRKIESFDNLKEIYEFTKNMAGMCQQITTEQDIGLFLLNMKKFRNTILPKVAQCSKKVGKTMAEIYIERYATMSNYINKQFETAESDPKTCQAYLNFLEAIGNLPKCYEQYLNVLKESHGFEETIIDAGFGDLIAETSKAKLIAEKYLERFSEIYERAQQRAIDLKEQFKLNVQKFVQNVIEKSIALKNDFMNTDFYDGDKDPLDIDILLQEFTERIENFKEPMEKCKAFEMVAQLPVTSFEQVEDLPFRINLIRAMWDAKAQLDDQITSWFMSDFDHVNPEEMQQTVTKYLKNIVQFEKYFPPNNIVPELKRKVEEIKEKIPTINMLRNPNIKPRHWRKIGARLNTKLDEIGRLYLSALEELGIYEQYDAIADISAQASSEAALEGLLKKVEDAWKTLELTVVPHKDSKDVYILSALDDINAILDETNINLTTIASSRSIGPIKPRVDDWVAKIDLFAKTLEEWSNCQTNWLYLEPIFSAPDIQRQLPNEAKMFFVVDKSWKNLMRRTAKNPLALPACTYPGLYDELKRNNSLLEEILKCLEAYLESKRVVFPRFYFLSNEELLEILAHTRNPHAVQPFLPKCFDAIARLGFAEKLVFQDGSERPHVEKSRVPDNAKLVVTTDISYMKSPEGEIIKLPKGLKARGNVEEWLGKVEAGMFSSLYHLTKDAIYDFPTKKRTEWVLQHASQLVLTVSQIMWARNVHLRLDRQNSLELMADFEKICFRDLNDLATMVRGKLEKTHRKTLVALITIDVHARDIITSLVVSKVHSSNDFEWIKQLRYYWDKAIDNCIACMASARHVYGYEYLGVSTKLVITPLTDKCYLCLMGALQLDLGGAPAGPAGTGKTETTKDLAKSLAIQCVVFNCSDGLDYKMMGRFFSGLVQSGAWCCFDEFNRIDIEVLSVIAQQLITIRNAKAAKLSRFMFEGREIKLVPQCAAFITMNPGYAGRTELPDNLKSVFRPFAMMVPDYGLIAEVILYSEGFESSKGLAQKMVNMYKLCSEQLSQQDHYDFGMRAVKSVLVMAGSLKRENPDKREDVVLIRALRDSNLPKFLKDDADLFKGILNDLFPGVVLPEHDYGLFQKAMEVIVEGKGLQPVPCTFTKTIQLYETMEVRHGVMTVGPTGGGKTTVLNVLKGTLGKLFNDKTEGQYYRPVTIYTLNPKSVTMGELYGEVNLATLEWSDGLLGIFVRKAVRVTEEVHQWVVCDGPVDAVWIENMNTVLDDNKMLCLANSERIKLTPWVHMVFEVQDLAQASPATVSRCGMVYVDSSELGWLPFVKSWAQKLVEKKTIPHHIQDFLINTFVSFVDNGLEFVKKKCAVGINQVDISKVAMLCSLLQNVLKTPNLFDHKTSHDALKQIISKAFAIAYIWSIGGNIVERHKETFGAFVYQQFEQIRDMINLPKNRDYWQIYYNVTTKSLQDWSSITPSFRYNPDVPFFDMLVPTIDTVCFGFLMHRLLEENHPVFFTGTTGVGKSVIAKEVLETLSRGRQWTVNFLNFSAQTSSLRTQEMIELKLEKRKKTLLSAPMNKRIAVFVDDVNMPKLETYGAQAPIELLRQFLDFGGLYDREKLFWKDIQGMVLCCACAPPGGGRNPLTPRFVRHFGMLLIPSPSDDSLKTIFSSILKGFLENFIPPIPTLAVPVVNAAVAVYKRITDDLLPTPAKSHYVFNLRDLSKCIQGVLQAKQTSLREPTQLYRLFFHECSRVFHDRLINEEDRSYFFILLRDICQENLGTEVIELQVEESGLVRNPPVLLYGDFMNPALDKLDRVYDEIGDLNKLKQTLQEAITEYNLVKAQDMKLIFFIDALEHICRISRILRAERGNALLVGVGGMGKQSLTKLSSHLTLCNCFQVELTQIYDYNSFHEDLRKLYFNAGGLNQDTVFLFVDTQIVVEEFLEDINNMLNSGEVPNLFEGDELEKCIIACRPAAKSSGIHEGNRDAIYDFFIQRVRSRLHLVLCMSPVGDAFRRRCRMFPSLVNCCTIDWFMPWPEEALVSVAHSALEKVVDKKLVKPMSNICFTIHASVEAASERFYKEMKRHFYVTPSSYLDLLKLYGNMLETQKKQITLSRERINNGLKKLYETNELVAIMKVQQQQLEPELDQKNQETLKLMKVLVEEKTAADEVRTVVMADEFVAKEKAGECQVLKDDAQADLDLALPAMEAAVKALEALNKNDINEVKVFNKPPYLVKFVMESVCLLLGAKQDWPTAKLVLGDVNFLKKLQDYDKDNIPDSLLKKLKKYIDDPQYVPDLIAASSKACQSLCLWVRAIDTYAKVYRVVEPKRQKLLAAETELNEMMRILREKQARLADVEAQIQKLERTYDAKLKEKAKLEETLQLCKTRMNRAGRLTSALSDEQERWEASVKTLGQKLDNLVGDILVASGCLAYLGVFTSEYRDELCSQWIDKLHHLEIPASESFSLIYVLADPYEVSIWNTCGLPGDKVSIENGIYVTRASRWPLMIDPQEQANRWIRQMEADNNLRMVKLTDQNFMRTLESSIRLGLPMLIWEVGETLDPTLKPVLTKSVFYQAGRTLIRVGDSDIEYDPNFRLYVTTKLSNPHYLPEICIQVTLVNFTVTPGGLEDQLLGEVVKIERPDLEKQRSELIIRINKDENQLKQIEDKILKMLFAASGNILDDEELVETLNESKETSAVISTRLQETQETEAKITVAREGYRSVAERGSVLYFVVAHLAEIDPMYQFSLKYFKMIFNNVIGSTPPSPTIEERLVSLMKEITLAVYNNVSRGLFEKDKLVFSFMLCISILIKADIVKQSHWIFLLRGPVGSAEVAKPKPNIEAISDMMWSSCLYLENLDEDFANLTDYIGTKINLVFGDYKIEIAIRGQNSPPCPIDWNEKLDMFKRMMILKSLKEEKVMFAVTEYVKVMLGKAFVESPLVSLNLLYADMNNITPLVFVLSTGSDPVGAFLRFAAETGNKERINSISLGQGQGPIASKMIEKGKRKGDWVFLQNCHLAASWMLTMEKIIMEIADNPREVHADFRLFLSSMPSTSFPVSVLQNSVKVTNEPPKGLRSNLKRAFTELQEEFFEGSPLAGHWRKMIFGLCFFHAVILERKKYGPLGWNIMYEFSESDRECALLNLDLFCGQEKKRRIPWDALQYITGEITYGGRVTDFWDQRTLKTILKKFFSPTTLQEGYKYSESGTYFAPESSAVFSLEHYRHYIENLPLIEEPEIFGMHDNANIAFQTKETGSLLGTILNVEVKDAGGGEGKSSDEIVSELSESIVKRIRRNISTDHILPSHLERDRKNRLPSLTTVLLQEVDRFNKMLNVLHTSIEDLKKAIKGFIVMSDSLEEVYKSLMNNMIPKSWSAKSYPSLKSLGSWVRDLELRIDFIDFWVNKGQPPSFWISGFFFPQGFMTGVLQNYARKYDYPIDELKIDFSVRGTVLNQMDIAQYHKVHHSDDGKAYKNIDLPEDGVLVHGLFLDAARFDMTTMLLADPNPGELNPPLPVLELVPSKRTPSRTSRYECPLYKTSVRAGVLSTTGHSTNFVIAVLLPTRHDQSYWILKGTALLTQITD